MAELNAGLIGSNIQRTRLPFALKSLCDLNNIDFSFELIDTALIDDFDFNRCVEERIIIPITPVLLLHGMLYWECENRAKSPWPEQVACRAPSQSL